MSSHKKLSNRGTSGKMNDSLLVVEIRRMIEEARSAVAITVNAGLTMLYWRIGRRINVEVLKGERANYGEEIVATLSQTF